MLFEARTSERLEREDLYHRSQEVRNKMQNYIKYTLIHEMIKQKISHKSNLKLQSGRECEKFLFPASTKHELMRCDKKE